ncbi:MAG: hypothetical protein KDD82_00625 [Planctomycetes bacterium]|nr:hypothetical protein [Planctomycetota bacterium]
MKHLLFSTLALVLAAPLASADIVHTRDGRQLEGVVETQGDVVVVMHKLGLMRIPLADVERIEETPDAHDELERQRAELAKGTADERYRFAVFARDNGFDDEALRAFYDVLRVDTNHPGARAALGYVQHEGQWVTLEDKFRSEGLVPYRGEWIEPAERAKRIEAARAEREAKAEAKAEARRLAREERRERLEAEREERRERLALAKEEARLAQLEYAKARAQAEAEAVRNGVLNGYYVPGYSYPLYGRYRVLGNGFLYPQSGLYCPQSPVQYGGFRSYQRSGFGLGTRLGGYYNGGNWGLRWGVGF